MLKLRWFCTCDKNRVKTELVLQYWNEYDAVWENIPYVECKTWEKEEYLRDKYEDF